jgi:hypothetical protein
MIGYATCGAFLGLSYFDLIWHLVAIMVILNHLVEQQIDKPVTQNETNMPTKVANPVARRFGYKK